MFFIRIDFSISAQIAEINQEYEFKIPWSIDQYFTIWNKCLYWLRHFLQCKTFYYFHLGEDLALLSLSWFASKPKKIHYLCNVKFLTEHHHRWHHRLTVIFVSSHGIYIIMSVFWQFITYFTDKNSDDNRFLYSVLL